MVYGLTYELQDGSFSERLSVGITKNFSLLAMISEAFFKYDIRILVECVNNGSHGITVEPK